MCPTGCPGMFQQILQRLSFVVSPDICTPVCTYLKVCRTVVTLKNVCNHFVTYTHRASQKEVRAGPYYYISCDGPTGRPAGLFRLSFMVGLVTRLADSVILVFESYAYCLSSYGSVLQDGENPFLAPICNSRQLLRSDYY